MLIPILVAIWVANYSVYGRRKLTKAARKAGHDIGRDQVARLMRAAGIRGASRAKKRFTTRQDPAALRAPDLVKRNFVATRPNQLWVADIQCRRRHCMSYADCWTMPMFVVKGCGAGEVVRDCRHSYRDVSQARMSGLGW